MPSPFTAIRNIGRPTAWRALGLLGMLLLLAQPGAALAGVLTWPLGCAPGDGVCEEELGLPDIDSDGVAYNCGEPGYAGHEGTDISISWESMDQGVEVLAAADGVVLWAWDGKYDRCEPGSDHPDCREGEMYPGSREGYLACTDEGNYCDAGDCCCYWCFAGGNTIVIRHYDTPGVFATTYDHLRNGSVLVKAGDYVLQGQPIAMVGSAGDSDGPHLHFEVWGDGFYEGHLADPWAGACGPNRNNSLWMYDPPWAGPSPAI